LTFRDHHWFTAHDIARASSAVREVSANLIVTTEKDAMRLQGGVRWAVLPMRVTIEPVEAFSTWLRARL
jgi:tetraacyldisaccharide-1-P 4'-kinase